MSQLINEVKKEDHNSCKTVDEMDLMLQRITLQLNEIEGKLIILKNKL